MRIINAKLILISCLGMLYALQAAAQENSPYSRYGIGDLIDNEHIVGRAMGGIYEAYGDPQTVNFKNPASYSQLQLSSLDLGVDGDIIRIANGNNNFRSGTGLPSYLQLGLPLKQNGGWGLNFGLIPVSRVNYNITRQDSLPGISSVGYQYEGTGGLYKALVGTGFSIKNISLGVNLSYLFGSINNGTRAIYPDSLLLKNSYFSQETSFGSLFWDAGAQYHGKLSKNLFLGLGATFSLQQKINVSRDILHTTFANNGETNVNQDTAYQQSDIKGKVTYPANFGFGIMLHDNGHWMVEGDYTVTNWSNYRYYDAVDSVQNNWRASVGFQYVPNANSLKSYWQTVAYRAGFYYGKDYIKYGVNDMPEFAFTIGMGLPLHRYQYQFSLINLSLEIGKRGTSANSIYENFYRLSVGFTLSDKWFRKRKFD